MYVPSHVTIHRHVSVAFVAIIRVSCNNTNNILMFIVVHLLVCYVNVNLLKPTGDVMYHQFNIQQLYVLPTLYLCVLYLSQNKQRLVPLTS
jgi:hypothetical protein